MNDDEKLKEWLNTHDGEDYCKFCIYDNECPHGMTCYGNEPIEPPCCNTTDKLSILDSESILEEIEKRENI